MLTLPPGAYMGTPLCPKLISGTEVASGDTEINSFSQERIETILLNCIKCIRGELTFADIFPYKDLLQILHRAADLFEQEPIMIEITQPRHISQPPANIRTVTIVGTLYGDAIQLFRIMHFLKSLSDTYYIFLGNYVGQGPYQLETIVFLFALKMRFKNQIIMLRGASEVLYDLKNNKGFFDVVQKTYPHWQRMFLEFHRVFDLMPVAAIIGSCLLLSGGVSQWMTKREVIKNIPKPTYISCMKFLQGCILADIFFGKPTHVRTQVAGWPSDGIIDDMFYPSEMHSAGYDFGLNGLMEILEQLHCQKLIRSRREFQNDIGCSDFFGNGNCYEVISTIGNPSISDYCSVMQLHCDESGNFDNLQIVQLDSMKSILDISEICETMYKNINLLFINVPYIPFQHYQNPCQRCRNHIINHSYAPYELGPRIISHQAISDWLSNNGRLYLVDDQIYQFNLRKRNHRNMKIRRLEMFPVCYDMVDSGGFGMYRSLITAYERPILTKYFDSYKYADPDIIDIEQSDAQFETQSVEEVQWENYSTTSSDSGIKSLENLGKFIMQNYERSNQTISPQWPRPRHLSHFLPPDNNGAVIFQTQQTTNHPILQRLNHHREFELMGEELCDKEIYHRGWRLNRVWKKSMNIMQKSVLGFVRLFAKLIKWQLFSGKTKNKVF